MGFHIEDPGNMNKQLFHYIEHCFVHRISMLSIENDTYTYILLDVVFVNREIAS